MLRSVVTLASPPTHTAPAGLTALTTNALDRLPPALVAASALVSLSLVDCSDFRLSQQDLELLPTASLREL